MAEAVGVGTGIVGVLSLTIQISQVVVQFGLDWKDAPKNVKGLMNELQTLKTVLSETSTNLQQDPNFRDAFEGRYQPSVLLWRLGPNAPNPTETSIAIEICTEELKILLDDLKKLKDGTRFGWQRFKGPFLTRNAQQSVERLHRHCQLFNQLLSIDAATIGAINLRETKDARKEQRDWHKVEENQRIFRWLSQLRFEEKQNDILSKRHPGTGQWLLDSDEFKAWSDGQPDKPSTLWCPGIPGAGKSVLTSIVIESLNRVFTEEDVAIAYMFCDYKDGKNQTPVRLLSSLVKQLAMQQKEIPREVIDLYSKHGDGQRPISLEECSTLLASFSTHFRRIFILVDALDEHLTAEDEENSLQLNILEILLGLQQQGNTAGAYALFFTSRENQSIEQQLEGCCRLDIRATDTDIQSYLVSRIRDAKFRFAKHVREDPKLGNTIVNKLVQKAQGIFLLPRLHLDQLGCQTSIRGLRQALDSLPVKLYDTYDESMDRIYRQVPEHKELALQALSWISSALRPLRVEELQHALAIQPGDRDLDREGLKDKSAIISVSAGLVTIDTESGAFRLVHFTVEEYFKETKHNWLPDVDHLIAATCLTLLSFDIFGIKRPGGGLWKQRHDRYGHLLDEYALLKYAANHWGYHIVGEVEQANPELILEFLMDDNKCNCAYEIKQLQSRDQEYYPGRFKNFDPGPCPGHYLGSISGMHLAVHFGLIKVMSLMIEKKAAVDSRDECGMTPLAWAAQEGQNAAAALLLSRADEAAGSQEDIGRTSFLKAAKAGYEGASKTLLGRADVVADSKDQNGRTPLSYAAQRGHEGVAKQLLDRPDVIADSRDIAGRTPLYYASSSGHAAMIKLLLDRDDVKVNSADFAGRTPLAAAIRRGHMEVLGLLFEKKGVADDPEKDSGRTPLWWASRVGSLDGVKRLLDQNDVIVDMADQAGDTPLSIAASNGHEEVVRLLLEQKDIAVNGRNRLGRTLLWSASRVGHTGIVKLLLDRDDVVVDSADEKGRTPLSMAVRCGYGDVAKLLEEKLAATQTKSDNSGASKL